MKQKSHISDKTDPGDLAVDFFPRYLRHSKGEWAGTPLQLEPWQVDRIVRPLFGSLKSDGTRRIRTVFVEIPRKNGKSTLGAGIACKLAFADRDLVLHGGQGRVRRKAVQP